MPRLTYTQAQSGQHYQSIPTGKFDITRLLQGHSDYWVREVPKRETKLKKLILADWTAPAWSPGEKLRILKALDKLLGMGFSIYMWHNGELIPLTQDLLSRDPEELVTVYNFDFRTKMVAPNAQAVGQAAVTQLALSRDEIFVLDDYWLKWLVDRTLSGESILTDETELKPRELSIAKLSSLSDPDLDNVITWMNHTTPPVSSLCLDIFPPPDKYAFLAAKFPSIPIKKTYRRIRLDGDNLKTLLKDGAITVNEETLTSEKINLTENLALHKITMKEDEFNIFLEISSGINNTIKELIISESNPWRGVTLPKGNLPAVELISFHKNYSSSLNLVSFLEATPYVKTLILQGCKIYNEKIYNELDKLKPNSLPNLVDIFLENSFIPSTGLKVFLQAAPNLETLTLSKLESHFPYSLTGLEENSLPNLKIVNLIHPCLDYQGLEALFKAAPNIEKLYLNYRLSITEFKRLKPGILAALKEVNLAGACIDGLGLKLFLAAAPNLKKISIQSSFCLLGEIILSPNSLPNLENIEIKRTVSYIGEQLEMFSVAAPNIKKMGISAFPSIALLHKFTHLEELDFNNIEIHPNILQIYSDALPKIKIKNYRLSRKVSSAPSSTTITLEELDFTSGGAVVKAGTSTGLDAEAENGTGAGLGAGAETGTGAGLGAGAKTGTGTGDGAGAETSDNIDPKPKGATLEGSAQSNTTSSDLPRVSPTSKITVDANTAPTSITFKDHRIFYAQDEGFDPPPPNYYRSEIYQKVDLNPERCTLNTAFTLAKSEDLDLISCVVEKAKAERKIPTSHGRYYCGVQKLHLDNEWQALASLATNEELQRYETTPDTEVEIKYSTRDNLYYIRKLRGAVDVEINFTLFIPNISSVALSKDIQDKIAEISAYEAKALELTHASGIEYLKALETHKTGACRHRVLIFKKWMEEHHPEIPVRIVINVCHAFVEISIGDQWFSYDLGGYAAKLEIDESLKPPAFAEPSVNYAGSLRTWDPSHSTVRRASNYYQSCFNGENKKLLIETASAEKLDALLLGLRRYARATSRPVFYVNSPDDLICSAAFIQLQADGSGKICSGPGGPLYEFIQKNPRGTLIVNYDNFSSDELVSFNSLLDSERKADGVALPAEMIVIGARRQDNEENVPGSDFYSRFDRTETCPITKAELVEKLTALPPEREAETTTAAATSSDSSFVINLYHSSDWKERLLGYWLPEGSQWRYQEGELQKAIEKGVTTLEIHNGLWEDRAFCQFWRELLGSRQIHYYGKTLDIPSTLHFVRYEGYDWPSLKTHFCLASASLSTETQVLNSDTLSQFLGRYQVVETRLEHQAGWIQLAKSSMPSQLKVYVTEALTEDQWARLLQEAKDQGVRLQVQLAKGTSLPTILKTTTTTITAAAGVASIASTNASAVVEAAAGTGATVSSESSTHETLQLWSGVLTRVTEVVSSTDVDTTVELMTQTNPAALIIDISECTASDLFNQIKIKLSTDTAELRYEFSEVNCAVANALAEGKTVILKGNFSSQLTNELASILAQRLTSSAPLGQLVLVSDQESAFQYIPHAAFHKVSAAEKKACLETKFTTLPAELEPYWATENLAQLITRVRYLKTHSGESSDAAWLGLKDLPKSAHAASVHIPADSKEQAKAFTEKRREVVNAALADQPYVYLAGLSGVGKTRFVEKDLKQAGDTLYQGEDELLAWAKDTTEGRKLLFIDEANLNKSQWSIFEGLFQEPSGILIKGKYYPLTKQHKVIFAGNPLSYGDERILAPLFARHGNTVVFEPLPGSVLYHEVLEPVFADTPYASQASLLAQPLLEVYKFLCQHSDKEISISPRELQMMALLTVSHGIRHEILKTADITQVAKYFTYQLARGSVPDKVQEPFENLFKPTKSLAELSKSVTESPSTTYLITSSRQEASTMLNEYLALREIRHEAYHNDAQRHGGLGGVVLEGEPGIGKSELVMKTLVARGYRKAEFSKGESIENAPVRSESNDKIFYCMPVSMPLATKEALLRQAFNEGAVVVIDELNSSPMMERLLNALLMGKTPEGKRPEAPGFMIIGTQNPISMAGRRAMSTALRRRVTTLTLAPYDAEEMTLILQRKMPKVEATKLVRAYQQQRAYAQSHHLEPAPTFRDVLRIATSCADKTGDSSPEDDLGESSSPLVDASAASPATLPTPSPTPTTPLTVLSTAAPTRSAAAAKASIKTTQQGNSVLKQNTFYSARYFVAGALVILSITLAMSILMGLSLLPSFPIGLTIMTGAQISAVIAASIGLILTVSVLAIGFRKSSQKPEQSITDSSNDLTSSISPIPPSNTLSPAHNPAGSQAYTMAHLKVSNGDSSAGPPSSHSKTQSR